jgi:hypothetical protein
MSTQKEINQMRSDALEESDAFMAEAHWNLGTFATAGAVGLIVLALLAFLNPALYLPILGVSFSVYVAALIFVYIGSLQYSNSLSGDLFREMDNY